MRGGEGEGEEMEGRGGIDEGVGIGCWKGGSGM